MNQHGHPVPPAVPKGTIYSFTSNDYGATFIQDIDYRLRFDDYDEFEVISLNDPKVILLPDGRYRMYVASMIRTGQGNDEIKWSIISATTSSSVTVEPQPRIPSIINLHQNYPNPFNPNTEIVFQALKQTEIGLTIYNMAGQSVWTKNLGQKEKGVYKVPWKGETATEQPAVSGIYFYRINVGDKHLIGKMSLVK